MNRLFELGISDKEMKFMLEQCSSIINMSEIEVDEKIEIESAYFGSATVSLDGERGKDQQKKQLFQ